MSLLAIDHIQLAMPTGEEPRARDFYQGILGIPEVEKPPALRSRGGVWFEIGTLKVHLGVEGNFRPAKKAHPAFLVSDLEQLSEDLRRHGYDVGEDKTMSDIKRFFSHDPFGNRIEFIQN